jgi:hypothetical protein
LFTPEPVDFVCSYLWCQDLLEQMFSVVRGRNGFTRNPTAKQFKYALRAIFNHAEIKISNGNSKLLENIPILRNTIRNGNFYILKLDIFLQIYLLHMILQQQKEKN